MRSGAGVIECQSDHGSNADDQGVFVGIEQGRVIGWNLVGTEMAVPDTQHQVEARNPCLVLCEILSPGNQRVFEMILQQR